MALDLKSFAIGKANGGGGGGITVEKLTATENGTYTAGSGKAFNPVVVDVASDKVEDYNIYFYNYDGTLVTKWTQEELAQATELPEYPENDVMAFEEWNWSLEELQTHAKWGCDVGALCHTKSGSIEVDIELDDETCLSPAIGLKITSGTVLIDWGDGSEIEENKSTGNVTYRHTYPSIGKYHIKLDISGAVWNLISHGYPNNGNYFVYNGESIGNGYTTTSYIYRNNVRAIRFPEATITLGRGALSTFEKVNYIAFGRGISIIYNDTIHYSTPKIFIAHKGCISYVMGENVCSLPYGFGANSTIINSGSKRRIMLYGFDNGAFARQFYLCDNTLEKVVIAGDGYSVDSSQTFERQYNLKSVVCAGNVMSIGSQAFSSCSSLQSVVIPDGCQSIGSQAFSFCSSLQSVVIPDGCQSIGSQAFSSCSSLQSVVIPDGCQSIGSQAFYRCARMTKVDARALTTVDGAVSCELTGTNAFADTNATIVFKDKVTMDIYASATNWAYYASMMTYEGAL